MPLQLDDLAALDAPIQQATGQPLMLAADAIDEDPDQPRHEFDANALKNWPRPSASVACASRSRCARTCSRPAAGC